MNGRKTATLGPGLPPWTVAFVALAAAACSSHLGNEHASVSRQLEERTGAGLPSPEAAPEFRVPETVSVGDGLSEDEAIALALFNNRRLAVALTDLDLARASLIEAGLIRNPVASLLFPVGPKQLESTVSWPLDFLVKRPKRIAAAKNFREETVERVVQAALDLARDVKLAYAELWLARERARVGGEASGVFRGIADLNRSRFEAGDISALEANAARAEALGVEDRSVRAASDALVARDRLALLLGVPAGQPLELRPSTAEVAPLPPLEALLERAGLSRAELRAAELAVDGARKRLGLAQVDWLAISGILDMNAQGKEGFEAGPGVQAEIPLDPSNRGSKARARAELERDVRRLREVRERVSMEVRTARQSVADARDADARWCGVVLPLLEAEAERSDKAYRSGDVSYLFVLDSRRRQLDGRLQAAEARAAVRRAEAALEHSVGATLARASQAPGAGSGQEPSGQER